MSDDNPFDELGVDPTSSPEHITAILRERAEQASTPEARERIKTLWRTLTLNADDRVRLALRAHPNDPRVGDRSHEELAELVPPRFGRKQAPPISATIEDVLLNDADDDDPMPPDECGPPAAFDRMSDLGD